MKSGVFARRACSGRECNTRGGIPAISNGICQPKSARTAANPKRTCRAISSLPICIKRSASRSFQCSVRMFRPRAFIRSRRNHFSICPRRAWPAKSPIWSNAIITSSACSPRSRFSCGPTARSEATCATSPTRSVSVGTMNRISSRSKSRSARIISCARNAARKRRHRQREKLQRLQQQGTQRKTFQHRVHGERRGVQKTPGRLTSAPEILRLPLCPLRPLC